MKQRRRACPAPDPDEEQPSLAPEAPPTERDDVHLAANRCPFCHDDARHSPSAACERCLARHHPACWDEAGRCSSCGHTIALERREPHARPTQHAARVAIFLITLAVAALALVQLAYFSIGMGSDTREVLPFLGLPPLVALACAHLTRRRRWALAGGLGTLLAVHLLTSTFLGDLPDAVGPTLLLTTLLGLLQSAPGVALAWTRRPPQEQPAPTAPAAADAPR